MNFLDLSIPKKNTGNDIVIWPVEVDLTTSWKQGTSKGPKAIIEASRHIELYDEELGFTLTERLGGLRTIETYESTATPEETYEKLLSKCEKIIGREKRMIALGGEHSITHPIVEAHKQLWPDVCVLQIDAHADLRETYKGSRHDHACPMKRLHDLGIHVTAVGIRSVDESEAQLLNTGLRKTFLDIEHNGQYSKITADIIESLPSEHVYITIDLDGLDPAIVPAVGTPVPGGLQWYETLHLLKALGESKEIVGADVVELKPCKELHQSDMVAAQLVYKMITYNWC